MERSVKSPRHQRTSRSGSKSKEKLNMSNFVDQIKKQKVKKQQIIEGRSTPNTFYGGDVQLSPISKTNRNQGNALIPVQRSANNLQINTISYNEINPKIQSSFKTK